jgi:hypothetical protein
MTFAEPDGRCRLCGNADPRAVRLTLVHWADAPQGMAYEHVPACTDRDACRARCLAGGDEWPLVTSKESR